jgi:carbamoyltransferase
VLRAEASSWFDLEDDRPYMTVTAGVAASRQIDPGPAEASFSARLAQPRSLIPACTHVDGSARVQTVGAEHHPRFHALLERFHADTGCPVLLNTSFNRAGEPIVHTPSEAVRCFLLAGLDHLVVERFVLDHGTVVEALR